jgi:endonuclease YncB( thermonuclease family)
VTSTASNWWHRQTRRRKSLTISGAVAAVLIGAGAAAGGQPEDAVSAPTTIVRENVSPDTTVTTQPPTTTPLPAPPLTYTVASVIDGDTIDVVASDGSAAVTVRLTGIDTPEVGACEADAATWTLTSMLQGQSVTLTPGGDGEDTDRYGRLLRYVDVAGVDAGLRLIEDGLAVARYDSRDGYGRHDRESTYVAADDAAPDYVCPPPTTTAPVPVFAAPQSAVGCDANYSGCVPIDSDVDCAGGSGNGPSYVNGPVRVIGNDIYGLDGKDDDGIACE